MPARQNGFAPACLNFAMLVSAPRAVMAMVSMKVEIVSMTLRVGASHVVSLQ